MVDEGLFPANHLRALGALLIARVLVMMVGPNSGLAPQGVLVQKGQSSEGLPAHFALVGSRVGLS